MKTIFSTLTLIALTLGVAAQGETPKKDDCKNDSTKMKFKNFDVILIERNKCPETNQNEDSVKSDEQEVKKEYTPREKFSTWSGLYFGVNGFLTPDNSMNLGAKNKFLELDYSKSISIGLNFAEIKFKIVPKYVGLTTGMGIQWNKYALKNNYNLFYNSDSVYGIKDTVIDYRKNKLTAVYLQVPLLFEFKTHERMSKAFHFGFGVVGGYRIGANLKQEYEANGYDSEGKFKGHYQLNPFQLYATFRMGYGKRFNVFANYGLTPVFEAGKGPDIRPFTVGLYLPF